MSKYTIWDYVGNLYTKRMGLVKDDNIGNESWMINKFISFDKDLLLYIAYVSKYLYCLGARYYILLYRLIPQSPSTRVKYVKPAKEFDNEFLDRVCCFFNLGRAECVPYVRILLKKYTLNELYLSMGLEQKGVK